jgi:hypothetical protein
MLYIRDMRVFELLTLVVKKTNSTMQLLKGIVSRDFLPLFFFIKLILLGP